MARNATSIVTDMTFAVAQTKTTEYLGWPAEGLSASSPAFNCERQAKSKYKYSVPDAQNTVRAIYTENQRMIRETVTVCYKRAFLILFWEVKGADREIIYICILYVCVCVC
jgi:hypothetical protein